MSHYNKGLFTDSEGLDHICLCSVNKTEYYLKNVASDKRLFNKRLTNTAFLLPLSLCIYSTDKQSFSSTHTHINSQVKLHICTRSTRVYRTRGTQVKQETDSVLLLRFTSDFPHQLNLHLHVKSHIIRQTTK